jgi:diguanylate cyclase (GGDEF)-like protein/PAS domain S-box-containing protein
MTVHGTGMGASGMAIASWLRACVHGKGLRRTAYVSRAFLLCAAMLFALASGLGGVAPAHALESIVIGPDQERIDITLLGELYEARGDRLSVETAPGPDGVAGRMAVSAKTDGTNPNWVVFALNNPTDQTVSLYLMAQRYDLIGSKIIWPDLDAPRIANLTVSLGFRPERVDNDYADMYRLVLEPGSTVTYIVELASADFPRLYLSNPSILGRKAVDLTLFNGILLGVAGVLALYLTAIFGANHKMIFPASALVAWSVVAYLCVDFGFWHKLFKLSAEDNATYRAATEAALAASIVLFLYVFLRLRLWHAFLAVLFAGWVAGQLGLVGLAVIDSRLAAGLSRLSYVPIAGVGSLLLAFLALRGQERALSLLPTWMLFLVWTFGVGVAVLGKLSGDVVVPALDAGLVLIVGLLSFTVTQYAFHAGEPIYGEDAGQFQMRVVALEASGASVWEWNTRRDDIFVGPEIDAALGHPAGTVRGNVEDWLQHLHASDRERLRLILWTIRERQGGEITTEFRMRRSDGSYLWYELRAQAVAPRQARTLRCAGLLRDITAQKRAQERLLHNAIHDSLTGLPNRELFLDRVYCAVARATEDGSKPTILFIDIDTFKTLNRTADFTVSDSMLLTISRRLARHLGAQDTMARIGGEQFGVLLSAETEPRHIALLAERVRRSLRAPMKIAGRDVVLTGSIGIAVYDGHQTTPADLLRESETAMYRAKRSGADRIELYKPEMRTERDEREATEGDLKQAIEKRQIRVYYQPVMRLGDEQLAGFEAMVRWEHPKHGTLSAAEFMPVAEETGFIAELSTYVMERAVRQVARWHRTLPRAEDPLFVSLNISSRHLFKQELVQDLRLIIGRESVPKGCLRLEVTESLIMENPEQAIEILDWLKGLGAGLSLDEFGAGYSSLAYLHRLAVDTIKIDRSLVMHGNDNKSGAVVLRAALAMSRELGKDVVAVGIERADDVAYLRALGCEYAQGFYFGEPMSEREVMGLLNALAKSSKREEKKDKKKKKADLLALPEAEPADMDMDFDDESQIPHEEVRTSLPVPTSDGRPLRKAKPKRGLLSKIGINVFSFGGSAAKSAKPAKNAKPAAAEAAAPAPKSKDSPSLLQGVWGSFAGKKKKKPAKRPDVPQPQAQPQPQAKWPEDGGDAGWNGNGNSPAEVAERLSRLERPTRRPPPPPPGTPPAPNTGLSASGGNVGMETMPNYVDLDQDQRERRRRGQSGGV